MPSDPATTCMPIATTPALAPPPGPETTWFAAWVERQDRQALAALFQHLASRALVVAHRICPDHAEDAVQEGFLAAMRGAKPTHVDHARAWVLAVVVNAARQRVRADARRKAHEIAAAQVPAMRDHHSEHGDLGERAVALLDRLAVHEREAIELRILDGLSSREAAQVLGRKPATIDVQVHRAIARLREWMGGGVSAAAVLLAIQGSAGAGEVPASLVARLDTLAASGPAPSAAAGMAWWAWAGGCAAAAGLALTIALSAQRPAPAAPAAVAADVPAPNPAPVDPPWRGRSGELLRWADPSATMSGGVDLDWLRRYADDRAPTSLFADPRSAPALVEIRRQFALWAANSDMLDFGPIADAAGGAVINLSDASSGGLTLATELGDQAGIMQAFTNRPFRGESTLDGSRWLLTQFGKLTPAAAPPGGLPLDAPLWLRGRLRPTLKAYADLDTKRSDPTRLTDWLGPQWRTADPVVTVRLLADDHAWRVRTDLTDIRPPVRRMSAASMGALARRGRSAHVAIALDPEVLSELARGFLGSLGSNLGWCTGDIAITADPGAPVPELGVVVGVRPDADRAGIAAVLLGLGGQPGPVVTQGSTWHVSTPLGVVLIVLGPDRLVATTASDAAPWFAEAATDDRLAIGHLDPALVRPWLPMLMANLPTAAIPFDETQLHMAVKALRSIIRSEHLIDLLVRATHQPPTPMPPQLPFSPRDEKATYAVGVLRNLSGGRFDPAKHIAIYGNQLPGHGEIEADTAYIRVGQDAWLSIATQGYGNAPIVDAAAIHAARAFFDRSLPLVLIAGRSIEDLEILPLAEQPVCNLSQWLPPVAVLADHLPAWSLSARMESNQFVIDETGWPLVTVGLVMRASDWLTRNPVWRHRTALDLRDANTVRHRNAQRLAALELIRSAMHQAHRALVADSDAVQRFDLLPKMSEMVRSAGIDPARLAPLFNGRTPTPANLDALGRYVPAGWTGTKIFSQQTSPTWEGMVPHLTIPLEDGWVAAVTDLNSPSVIVTCIPLPVTRQPGDPVPGPARWPQGPPPASEPSTKDSTGTSNF